MIKSVDSNLWINPQELNIWLACNDGWNRMAGFEADIHGLKCAIVFDENFPFLEMSVSEWFSGFQLKSVNLLIPQISDFETKEATFQLMYSVLTEEIVPFLETKGIDNILNKSREIAKYYEAKFGKMPEVELMGEWRL